MSMPSGQTVTERNLVERETIVVIDDDYAMRFSCTQILSKSGFHVETFEDGIRGLEAIARLQPDMVVVDLKMPGISGMEVISRVREINPLIIIVVITGYATIGTAVEAMKAGAYDFLPKPFTPDELRLIINRGLERRHLLIESRRLEMERDILKRRFLTFVSHELKTPLVAIHQYLDLLNNLGDTQEAKETRQKWIGRCLKRSEEMRALIEDWLTLSTIESDTLSRKRIPVDLKELVARILATCAEEAIANDISLTTDFPGAGYVVRGDPNCLSVLFHNLMVNAIKYNKPHGTVCVVGESSNGEVAIAVRDTGIGIPKEYQPFLFDEFFRIEGDGQRKTAGTGLGLPICRKIVSELGGSIEVESELGAGSTFRIRLPLDAGDPQHGVPENEAAGPT
jgi:two-component system sensor histidine kinase/response regulator